MIMNLRQITEVSEVSNLSTFAQLSKNSRGRSKIEEECDIRTAYQRDRDRIIHSKSFRVLKEKTQVFIVKDDSWRTRLTHTLELSQISRTIARALRLNEDLVEAIALGHDLGHTCFGHSGEEVLHQLTGHFKHNEQSLRLVEVLEREGKGLNLTYEVKDGILKHTGSEEPSTLEGKLVRIADRITYLCHDIQDSINAGILDKASIPKNILEVLGETQAERINIFVRDIIDETSKQLNYGNKPSIYQSPLIRELTLELRRFMFEKVYYGEICMREKEKASFIVSSLYQFLMSTPEALPIEYRQRLDRDDVKRVVTDFIAACTDSYAIKLFQDQFIPSPQGL